MINIKNLTLKVDNLTIFDSADISIPKNKTTILVGSNGVGKTTLLRVISGILNPKKAVLIKIIMNFFIFLKELNIQQGLHCLNILNQVFIKKIGNGL